VEYNLYRSEEKIEPWRFRHGLLLFLTVLATLLAGTTFLPRFADYGLFGYFARLWHSPALLLLGAPYAVPLLLILGVHEMGHFLTASKYGVRVTWPYFIPGPPFFSLGTFGAFIRLKSPIRTRGNLLEIGANGPIWGSFASLLVALAGFWLSAVGFRMPADLGFNVHLPIAYWLLQGTFGMGWSFTLTFFPNPVLFAAWIGFFVQGINLMPIGQLDGGHVLYALAGGRHRLVSMSVGILFLLFAIFHPQWILWVLLIFIVLGLRHPPCIDDSIPLTKRQVSMGMLCVLLFVLTFLPVPFA